jgi:hypothetical protein
MALGLFDFHGSFFLFFWGHDRCLRNWWRCNGLYRLIRVLLDGLLGLGLLAHVGSACSLLHLLLL